MDEYYANLLEDTTDETTTESPSLLAVVLSRQANAMNVHVSVCARIPRKRESHDDPVKYKLEYFKFLDDKRRFTNLDSLLTRMSPVGVVHIACNESGDVKSTDDNGTGSSNTKSRQKRVEVSNLLSKLAGVIDSRRDILPHHFDEESTLTDIIKTLPREISNLNSLSHHLSSTMKFILGDESDSRYQKYKNDTKLMSDNLSKQAIGLLLHAESIRSNENDQGCYEICKADLQSHLAMDRTAMDCINLLPPKHKGISSDMGGNQSNNSIYGILNHCKTKMGMRTLEVWIRQPCVDLDTILYRQKAVQYMVEIDSVGRDRLREGLGGLRGVDLDRLCSTIDSYKTSTAIGGTRKVLESLYKMHLFAYKQLPTIKDALSLLIESHDGIDDTEGQNAEQEGPIRDGALKEAYSALDRVNTDLSMSIQLVETLLDFDLAPREFLVKASFNDELAEIKKELDGVEIELQHLHDEMNEIWSEISGQNSGQVRLERNNKSNDASCAWCFRLPDMNDSKILQNELGTKVTVHKLLKNGVHFSTKELLELGTKKHDLLIDYESHQRSIVENAMTVAGSYAPVLERASDIISELDVLASLAHVAAFSPHGYCRPKLTDSDDDGVGIKLEEARHPCVELQDDVDFIPNDFNLVYGVSNFLLCTGPNCGGKSTFIRSLGAIIAMAQIGSYVPCKSAEINVVHHILARVGAGDLQDRGISTFMAEMLEASSILQTATKRSLIIIDELGRGTSTSDGYGLASSISEYIVQKIGCMTVFATHFHELTALEDKEKAVVNCHVTAQRATDGSGLTFLYEVRPGPCLESFGIQVAEMANVPAAAVRDAKRKAEELENFGLNKKRNTDNDSNLNEAHALNVIKRFKELPFNSFKTTEEKQNALKQIFQ